MRVESTKTQWAICFFVLVLLTAVIAPFVYRWYRLRSHLDGGAVATFVVHVVEDSNGEPIAKATVQIYFVGDSWQADSPTTQPELLRAQKQTDSEGEVLIQHLFGASWDKVGFREIGTVSFDNHIFVVSAPGYRTVRKPVKEFTGASRSVKASRQFDISFRLKSVPVSEPTEIMTP